MSFRQEIARAIGSHGIWKVRLREAIDGGSNQFNIAEVRADDVCAFGQWLYGLTIPSGTQRDVNYLAVVELHAQFHRCAAQVLECVAAGDKTRAKAMLAPKGEYSVISSQLVAAMVTWNKSIKRAPQSPRSEPNVSVPGSSDCRLPRENSLSADNRGRLNDISKYPVATKRKAEL